jgi:cellobiose phosphorylase/biotin operon repressor
MYQRKKRRGNLAAKMKEIGYDSPFYVLDEAPLGKEALLSHAKDLALAHKLKICKKTSGWYMPEIVKDKNLLEQAYKQSHESVKEGWEIDSVAEWLIDNYYLLEEQFKQLEISDKTKNKIKIPCMRGGIYDSFPRIFVLAAEIVIHMEARLNEDLIVEFLNSYQSVSPLNMKELWLFPDMLMVALIKAAAGVAVRTISTYKTKAEARSTAELLAKKNKKTFKEFIAKVFSPENKELIKNSTYIKALYTALRDEPKYGNAIAVLDKRLKREDMTADSLIRLENGKQAKDQTIIANAITSVRMLSQIPWDDVFEKLSVVDDILGNDEVYLQMDFDSRDYYRKCVETIAHVLRISESAVAKEAVKLKDKATEAERKNAGYYIIGEGKEALYTELTDQLPLRLRIWRYFQKHMLGYYSTSVLLSALIINICLFFGIWALMQNIWTAIIGGIFTFLPVYGFVHPIISHIFMRLTRPAFIPKMDYKDGIPKECRTVAVVPALVNGYAAAAELLEDLEVYFIANQDENLFFMLLGDFGDSNKEFTEEEIQIVRQVEQRVEELNAKYGREIFYYLHRKRIHIPEEHKYMGEERKRGALMDFCGALKGLKKDGFLNKEIRVPQEIKYVLTLDADTQMPRDAAKRLVGAMSHPLNSPVLNIEGTAVIKGYALMQPRIGIDVVSAAKTYFSLIFSGQAGLDTYSTASSDLYQDLFGEGIFTGKGIFDLDIYYSVLHKAFPKRSILSHDLIEGSYLRTALVTDVILVDGFPSNYDSYAKRQHRWIRGDWQLIKRLSSKVITEENEKIDNPVNALSKYKICDNLLRSLLIPACFAAIFLGLTFFYAAMPVMVVLGLLTLFYDPLSGFVVKIIMLIKNANKGAVFKDAWFETRNLFRQSFFRLSVLPYEALMNLDAIVRTLYRIYISKKKMLEWVTAAESEKKAGKTQKAVWQKMIAAPIMSAVLLLLSSFLIKGLSVTALVISALWFFAPLFAYRTAQPIRKKDYQADTETVGDLRLLARKTWRFYEDFCTEENYMWAPDNFQEYPYKKPVDRTSSTNVAYSLIANVIARDFGYISLSEMLERMDKCITGIEKCDLWHGHMYNWYEMGSLKTMKPEYISSVDSGNLACYLLAACEGVQELLYKPLFMNCALGLKDTMCIENKSEKIKIPNMKNAQSLLGFYQTLQFYLSEGWTKHTLVKKSAESFARELERLTPFLKLLLMMPADKNNPVYGDSIEKLTASLDNYSPGRFADDYHAVLSLLSKIYKQASGAKNEAMIMWVKDMEMMLGQAYINTKRLTKRAVKIISRMRVIFDNMDFSRLYDEKKGLFSIGFNIKEGALSNSYYDLLASEARQTGFIAIAKGDVPQKHWFRLSRPLAVMGERRVLLSWGGTMFEYFMPLLLMKNYEYTLLDETYNAVVEAQKMYGDKKHVPWGVSESGYYAFDLSLYYQYKAFGVQKLGLKSGLSKDTVISPYSTCLALMINPLLAIKNMEELKKVGLLGKYGYYEAADYTHGNGKDKRHIVKSYMAHHQGMIFAALSNYISDNFLQLLFHNAPIVKATELLLKEKIPARNVVIKEYEHQAREAEQPAFKEIRAMRKFSLNTALYPETHMLSNGKYTCVLTQFGPGYSTCNGILLNRWNNDFMREYSGIHLYMNDEQSGMIWSSGFMPSGIEPEDYMVSFDAHKAEYARTDRKVKTVTEICVSPEADLELRRITITNESEEPKHIRLTCAVEPVLCDVREFIAHPAFAEFFLEQRVIPEQKAVSVRRRMRKPQDRSYGMVLKAVCGEETVHYELNRESFFGRQNANGIPAALTGIKNSQGKGSEMVLAISVMLHIPKGEKKTVSFVLSAAENEGDAISQAIQIGDDNQVLRVMDLAWTHSQVEMRFLGLKHSQANVYQMIASRMIMHTPLKTKFAEIIKTSQQPFSHLWQYGISGDLPIVLLLVKEIEDLKRAKDILLAHEFWRLKGFRADLVMLNQSTNDYFNPVREKLNELAQGSHARELINTPGGLYILDSDQIGEAVGLLMNAASVILEAGQPFSQQLLYEENIYPHKLFSGMPKKRFRNKNRRLHILENGLGGFVSGGKEYRAIIKDGMDTPAAWSNILTNKNFGSLVTMEGGGYTWADNCRMMRITPFRNDGLKDIAGEGILIRDDNTGEAFSLMPGMLQSGEYAVTFGRGYAIYERTGSLDTRMDIFTDIDLNIKVSICTVANLDSSQKSISLYYFMEPVLGEFKERFERSVVTDKDESGAIVAVNAFSYVPGLAYIYAPPGEVHFTTRKEEFFGHFGCVYKMGALNMETLSDTTGTGTPCLALQIRLTLAPGEKAVVPLMLGFARDTEDMRNTIIKFDTPDKAFERYEHTKAYWEQILSAVRIQTPSNKFDVLVNHWLVYQVYASRLFARTGFYQSGGAYGYRDQLQDMLALMYSDEQAVREHLLRCASKQFIEGDVLHWWHEKSKGVRTTFKDDLLFLPYIACIYAKITGDYAVFQEKATYLKSIEIPACGEDLYMDFEDSEIAETLFLHCARAIDKSLELGERGLARIGGGDWCDGMNHVGAEGKGESVWLSFFLYDVLNKFSAVSHYLGETDLTKKYTAAAHELSRNIFEHAWDGKWYLRAFYDDGTPLGSVQNEECAIDLIPQAWAAMTDCGPKQRQIEAYQSAMQLLLKKEDGLICLFAPPFDKTPHYPGYIKGYRPGMRENGGQYTHAAAWQVIAAAELKRKEEAFSLFEMLSPVRHTSTQAELIKYRGEPYVFAGDVSYAEGLQGRAGWTWYTGSASWMYVAGLQSILGMHKEAQKIYIEPCIPESWQGYRIEYRYKSARYMFIISNASGKYKGKAKLQLDGYYIGEYLYLQDDGRTHEVKAELLS